MAAKRYELSDEQWEMIKDMLPKAKTGRPPKDNRIILNAVFWLARSGALYGQIFLNAMVRTKLYTVVFANGILTVPFCTFLRL